MRISWLPFAAGRSVVAEQDPVATARSSSSLWPAGLLSLRARTTVLVSIIFGILMLAFFYPLRQVLLGNALALETHEIRTDLLRANDALFNQGENLQRLAVSYALWDDTYEFMLGGDPGYMDTNHTPATMESEARDVVYLLDTAGEPVAAATSQHLLARGLAAPELPATVRALLAARVAADGSYVGLVAGPGAPMLVTAAPILRSDQSGPAAGVLAMGLLLDGPMVEELARRTHLHLDLHLVDDPSSPADVLAVAPLIASGGAPLVRPLDEVLVGGYALLSDSEGRPLAVLRVLGERLSYQQGSAGVASLAVALMVAWAVFAVVITFLLERLILRRVARLSAELRRIGVDGDLGERVTVDGRDELGAMSATVNGMLDALAQATRAQQEAAEEGLRLQAQVIEAEREAIARVSHELRNPLTPIKGFVDLLLKGHVGPLTPDQHEVLATVRDNVNRMVALVGDLLDIGKAEAGTLKLQLETVGLPAAVDRVLALLEGEIKAKGLRVERDEAADLPLIEAEARRIDQILINLISNAVKYTYDGGTIGISLEHKGPGSVTIRVSDTGVGLTPEQQDKLFTPFFRADTPLHHAGNGTGLGLRITRSLVELHGGSIAVTSTYGAGSVFVITLPIAQPHAPASP